MKGKTLMYGTMVYVLHKGEVLMLNKDIRPDDPNSGYFTLPGGKLEYFEKGIDIPNGRLERAIREVPEETGIAIVKTKLRGTVLFDNYEREFPDWPNPKDYLVNVCSANAFTFQLKDGGEGAPLWVPKSNIKNLPKHSGDDLIYDWLDEGRNFMGVIKHKGMEVDPKGTWVDFFNP